MLSSAVFQKTSPRSLGWNTERSDFSEPGCHRSISMGHQTEDVIGFCVDFIPGLNKIGLPKSRYEGGLAEKGTLGGVSIICRDGHSWSQAHYTVL